MDEKQKKEKSKPYNNVWVSDEEWTITYNGSPSKNLFYFNFSTQNTQINQNTAIR